ncbi:MAG: FAD-dependent oxidoreductase [Thermoplasmata archaeon]
MPRIGVFICHCGHNIASVVDVEKVVEFAKSLPNVVFASHNLYSCSEEGLGAIRKSIEENRLDRVVVAACTPRTHEPLFRRNCERAGVNKYLFEFVNIREHCSWIHAKEPEAATRKAMNLVAMGVAKAGLLDPQTEGESSVIPVALVIGGGIAGLAAAASLVSQGIETHLVEKQPMLGGMLNEIPTVGPEMVESKKLVDVYRKIVEHSPKAHLHLSSRVSSLSGFIGNFEATIRGEKCDEKVKVGAIIVATGGREFLPKGEYGYGSLPGVMTQLELERKLAKGEVPRKVVMIQCVGSRQPGREYCSRVCCNASIKNAIRILEATPDAQVSVLHRDIMSYGTAAERAYRTASEMGARFFRYTLEKPPSVKSKDGGLAVEFFDETLDEFVSLDADAIVLATPIVSVEDVKEIAKMLKVPVDKHGFFLEAHVKLRPVEFATEGIFICGSARWPSTVSECIAQGLAAAAKASIPIREGKVIIEPITAWSDPEKCIACGNCVVACPYEAIELVTVEGKRKAKVNEAKCKGCGNCVAACHNDAMQQKGFGTRQLGAMIDALINNALEVSQ